MSQENVELVRRLYESWNRGRVTPEAIDALFDERVELRLNAMMGSYRGHDGVRQFVGDLMDDFRELTIEVEEVIDAGNRVVVVLREHGIGRSSSAPVDSVETHVWTVRDGRAFRADAYANRAKALEAVGLRE